MLSDRFRRIYADNEGLSRRPKLLKLGKTVFNVATHWLFIPDAPGVPRVQLLRRQARKDRLACRLRLLQPASTRVGRATATELVQAASERGMRYSSATSETPDLKSEDALAIRRAMI